MILSLDDKMTFGKYGPTENKEPYTIAEVIKDDPDYLAWACDTIAWFELDSEAIEALDFALFDKDDGDHYCNPASPYFGD